MGGSRLHVELIGPDRGALALVVHGILGSGRNWRSMARRMAERLPGWRFALVDLRNHGNSQGLAGPHTVAACAADLDALDLGPVSVAVGHSFGGKVVAQWLRSGRALDQVWILDSPPGSRPADPTGVDTLGVLDAIGSVPLPAADRDAIRSHLRDRGLDDALIAWLLTSAVRRPDGWHWLWDLDAVDAMIRDYLALDLMPWLTSWEQSPVELVRAERSDRWRSDELAAFEQRGPASTVRLHTLSNAGHWLHVDNPLGLLELFEQHWPGANLRPTLEAP